MSAKSNIEWTDATWNPLYGCSDASEGCRNCYAKGLAHRFANSPNPKVAERFQGLTRVSGGKVCWTGRINLVEDQLLLPLRWKKPRMIFVNSQSDLFHPSVPFEFVDKVFAVMALCPHHTFQVLTKRPERMAEYLSSDRELAFDAVDLAEAFGKAHGPVLADRLASYIEELTYSWVAVIADSEWPFPNVWLGTSVEDHRALHRIGELRRCPAAVRFLSCEPMIGPVGLSEFLFADCDHCDGEGVFCEPWDPEGEEDCSRCDGSGKSDFPLEDLHWVICGGESGPNARPMNPEWARSLRDQCVAAGVPFFFKQWGEWLPYSKADHDLFHSGKEKCCISVDGERLEHTLKNVRDRIAAMSRVGKKRAGRLLDGREWNEMPEVGDANA